MQPNYVHLPEVASTNSWLLSARQQGRSDCTEGTVAFTLRQTSGRGQMGNVWESEADKNIAFSVLLQPQFVPVAQQFVLSQLVSVAIVEAVEALAPALQGQVCVKWPNDIYVGHRKLAGILIENRLMGSRLEDCVVGIGINVQQEQWLGGAPNPVSLRMLGVEVAPEDVMRAVATRLAARYAALADATSRVEQQSVVRRLYGQCLYRRTGLHRYLDVATGVAFDATIAGVADNGPLSLLLPSGELRSYWFKEVRFVLPSGLERE